MYCGTVFLFLNGNKIACKKPPFLNFSFGFFTLKQPGLSEKFKMSFIENFDEDLEKNGL